VLSKTIKHSKITLTGHTKSMRNALFDQAFNEQMAGEFWGGWG
jgi:hypothetical protein